MSDLVAKCRANRLTRSVAPELLAVAAAVNYIVHCNPASWLQATEVE
jgi:hypothetical protein